MEIQAPYVGQTPTMFGINGSGNVVPGTMILPATTYYSEALSQWNMSWSTTPFIDAADQGTYWNRAASDLLTPVNLGTSNTPGHAAAAGELQNLAAIPITDVTPAQSTEADTDSTELNAFFNTSIPTS